MKHVILTRFAKWLLALTVLSPTGAAANDLQAKIDRLNAGINLALPSGPPKSHEVEFFKLVSPPLAGWTQHHNNSFNHLQQVLSQPWPDAYTAQFRQARLATYLSAMRMRKPMTSVSYLPPVTFAIDTHSLRTPGPPDRANLGVRPIKFPIGLDGHNTLKLAPSDTYDWMVGGAPIQTPPEDLDDFEQILDSLVSNPSFKAGTRLYGDFVYDGDPVENLTDTELDHAILTPVSRPAECKARPTLSKCLLSTVVLHDRYKTICTGMLVSPEWVLTAAHCACNSGIIKATIGDKAPVGRSVAPYPRFTMNVGSRVEFYNREFCSQYKLYNAGKGPFPEADIALLKLDGSRLAERSDVFIDIAHPDHFRDISIVDVVGFGAREEDRRGGEKFAASLVVLEDKCGTKLHSIRTSPENSRCRPAKEFVAVDPAQKKDSCFGDSGAGVLARLQDGRNALLGIVSRGISKRCGPGGINTLVASVPVRKWLQKITHAARLLGSSTRLAQIITREPR